MIVVVLLDDTMMNVTNRKNAGMLWSATAVASEEGYFQDDIPPSHQSYTGSADDRIQKRHTGVSALHALDVRGVGWNSLTTADAVVPPPYWGSASVRRGSELWSEQITTGDKPEEGEWEVGVGVVVAEVGVRVAGEQKFDGNAGVRPFGKTFESRKEQQRPNRCNVGDTDEVKDVVWVVEPIDSF